MDTSQAVLLEVLLPRSRTASVFRRKRSAGVSRGGFLRKALDPGSSQRPFPLTGSSAFFSSRTGSPASPAPAPDASDGGDGRPACGRAAGASRRSEALGALLGAAWLMAALMA